MLGAFSSARSQSVAATFDVWTVGYKGAESELLLQQIVFFRAISIKI